MFDILPFPNITGKTTEEQSWQINNYLSQLKEQLEFLLTDIGEENLSDDLRSTLNNLGADIKQKDEERNAQIQQVSNKTLTVSDVVNSASFKASITGEVEGQVSGLTFSVDYETGNLLYEIKETNT